MTHIQAHPKKIVQIKNNVELAVVNRRDSQSGRLPIHGRQKNQAGIIRRDPLMTYPYPAMLRKRNGAQVSQALCSP